MAEIYFDFSATNNGDGTTAAQAAGAGLTGAYNTTDGVTAGIGDTWWVRRSGVEKTITTTIYPVHNFAICGWPKAGDENYDERPASGTSNGWDADGAEYAELYKLSNILYHISTAAINGFYTSRMRYVGNGSVPGVNLVGNMRSMKIIKCEFRNLSLTQRYLAASISGHRVHVKDCLFNGGPSSNAWTLFSYLYDSIVESCTFSYGIDMNRSIKSVFSNIDMTLAVDAAHNTTLEMSYCDNCRLENWTIDNSIYTGVSPPTLMAGTSPTNCQIDAKVKGGFTTLSLAGNNTNVTLTPLLSGDTISTTGMAVASNNRYVIIENFSSGSFTLTSTNTVVFLKNISVPDNNYAITSALNSSIYSLNHGGIPGFWKAFGHKGIIESSDVYRTGGSAHSLRCMLESANTADDVFPCLGVRDIAEVIFLDLLAGTHTITVYGAHRFFANALHKSGLYIETDYLDSSDVQKSITSSRQGALTTDASVWNGDTDLTVFKMELTVTLSTDQRIPVRILGNYEFVNSAYLYLDPIPVIS